jgi:hypothetical protein
MIKHFPQCQGVSSDRLAVQTLAETLASQKKGMEEIRLKERKKERGVWTEENQAEEMSSTSPTCSPHAG